MNIQRFGDFDTFIDIYNNEINKANQEMATIENEKNTLLNNYDLNYQQQLSEHENLMNQQQQNIDTWATTQKETQQKQTDYNVGLINQNKAEAQKQTDAELGNAYIDYQKGLNQFGGNAESMATNGLSGTGFAKNTEIAMNMTYQNRVGTAKSALMKANTEYDNQIQQALLNNDAALAEIALQQMQQSYQLALQGFEYKTNLYNNKVSYEQSISDTYFNRNQTLQSRIDNYNSALATINQKQIELDEQRKQRELEYEQWQKEMAEKQRQYDLSLAEEKRQFNEQMSENKRQYNQTYQATYNGVTFDDNGTKQTQTQTQKATETKEQYNERVFGNSAATMKKDDYYFDNGYQPRYLYNKKLNTIGVTAGEVFSKEDLKALNISSSQNIWNLGGNYYVWIPGVREYKQLTNTQVKKAQSSASWWDKLWHKGI